MSVGPPIISGPPLGGGTVNAGGGNGDPGGGKKNFRRAPRAENILPPPD